MCVWKAMADGGAIGEEYAPPATPTECIDRLLQRTGTRYWRKGLFYMLRGRQSPDSLKRDIHFLVSNITSAIRASSRGGRYSIVNIDYDLCPHNLDLVNWRRVLVGMKLVLEEPDTNNNIRFIGVCVGVHTDANSLHGLLIILKAMIDLPWVLIQMVIYTNSANGGVLFETLTDSHRGYTIPSLYLPHIRVFYEDNMEAMRTMGFYRRSPEEEVTWTRPAHRHDCTQSVLHVLRGLLRVPSAVQPTS